MPARVADGPDFICIGLPKAGTGWLYDQVAGHPDFWMPPIKELRYFGRSFPPPVLAAALEARRRREAGGKARIRTTAKRTPDDRDHAFFDAAERISGKGEDLDAYAALFAPKGELLSGDVSPVYALMKRSEFRPISERFPDVKVLALLRDPVERAWSRWRMEIDLDRAPAAALQDADAIRAFLLRRPDAAARSAPSRLVENWSAAFGDRFRHFFLDDVSARPAETRAAILGFVGADPAKLSRHPDDFNKKAGPRAERSAGVRALMRELFEAERRRCAETLGGPARDWVDAPY